MDTQRARHRHQERADGGPAFRRRREQGSWRLTADGLDHDTALALLHERRPSVGAWPGCRVGRNGSIALNVPGRNQNAKFRGRLHQMSDPDGGGDSVLLVSGVMLETMSGIMLPALFGFVTLLMLGIFVAGALTVTIAPLVIGLVAAPLMGAMAVSFWRGRGRAYDLDTHRLYRDLHKLLEPLRPEPRGESPHLHQA
ncbi:hypothetical protein AB5J72_41840 [Streptomyces sp. CG1]|uniref:hypothetical protein n=1 Tax=Streptomyces sp. CG1 TaxID=1287523 RepID=UPI0034E29AB9